MVDQSKLILHFALMTPLGALSTALVGLRFYTRLYITKMRLAADDYLIFVAMVSLSGGLRALLTCISFFPMPLPLWSESQVRRQEW